MPVNTILGGVCWTPIAFLVKESMIMMRIKELIITTIEGSNAAKVSSMIISSAGTFPPFKPVISSFIRFLLLKPFQNLDPRLTSPKQILVFIQFKKDNVLIVSYF